MKIILFGNGEINDYPYLKSLICNFDFVICCDGGVRHAFKMDIMPDLILGDFDSAPDFYLDHYRNKNIEFKTYPNKKDHTDMEIGLDAAIGMGADEIVIFGGTGSRIDHSMANLFLLSHALKKGVNACIVNENNVVRITDNEITVEGERGDVLSLIPITQRADGVTTVGLAYPLINETLFMDSSRGVSNVFEEKSATIKIETGVLLVIQARD